MYLSFGHRLTRSTHWGVARGYPSKVVSFDSHTLQDPRVAGHVENVLMNFLYPVLTLGGGLIGTLAAGDAPFKVGLVSHLLTTTGIGVVAGVLFAVIITVLRTSSTPV